MSFLDNPVRFRHCLIVLDKNFANAVRQGHITPEQAHRFYGLGYLESLKISLSAIHVDLTSKHYTRLRPSTFSTFLLLL